MINVGKHTIHGACGLDSRDRIIFAGNKNRGCLWSNSPLISRQVDKPQDPSGACQHPPEEVNGNAVEADPETKEVADTKHQSLG